MTVANYVNALKRILNGANNSHADGQWWHNTIIALTAKLEPQPTISLSVTWTFASRPYS